MRWQFEERDVVFRRKCLVTVRCMVIFVLHTFIREGGHMPSAFIFDLIHYNQLKLDIPIQLL